MTSSSLCWHNQRVFVIVIRGPPRLRTPKRSGSRQATRLAARNVGWMMATKLWFTFSIDIHMISCVDLYKKLLQNSYSIAPWTLSWLDLLNSEFKGDPRSFSCRRTTLRGWNRLVVHLWRSAGGCKMLQFHFFWLLICWLLPFCPHLMLFSLEIDADLQGTTFSLS